MEDRGKFDERELSRKIHEGELPRNWSSDIMKMVWGPELASNINDKQSKE